VIIGICWPTPGAQPQPLPEDRLRLLREQTLATHLRINLHHDQPAADQMVTAARAAGLEVLPILDFDYAWPDCTRYARFCAEIVGRHRFPAVELGNEPHILHDMPPDAYAAVFTAGAASVRELELPTQIYIAGEITKPIGVPIDYFRRVRDHVPESLYDVVAIHPYRNPEPPSCAPFGTRARELQHYQSAVPDGKGIAVTEVGWDLRSGVTEALQASYLREELAIWGQLGVDAVYVFQHTDPPGRAGFGLFTADWSPRPAAAALAELQRSRGLA
jgi:hypothetical protein